jgi:hypothetical protein
LKDEEEGLSVWVYWVIIDMELLGIASLFVCGFFDEVEDFCGVCGMIQARLKFKCFL